MVVENGWLSRLMMSFRAATATSGVTSSAGMVSNKRKSPPTEKQRLSPAIISRDSSLQSIMIRASTGANIKESSDLDSRTVASGMRSTMVTSYVPI